jgi:integrase
MNLNEKAIAKIQVASKRQSFPDQATPHFGLRVENNGRKSFYYYAKIAGKPRYKALGEYPQTTLGEARAAARKLDVEVDVWKKLGHPADADPFNAKASSKPGNAPTFAELVEAYIKEHVRVAAKKPEEAEYSVQHFARKYFAAWANRRLDTLSVHDLVKVKQACGGHHVTANRCTEFIRRLINWSGKKQEGKVSFWRFPENFATEITTYKETERKRFLNAQEGAVFSDELAKAENRDLRDFLILALGTGARKMDVYSMRWADIDWELKLWHVPRTTKVEPYPVQLLDNALAVLEERRKNALSDTWVFPSATAKSGHIMDLKRAWTTFRKRCGLVDFKVHDLRHTTASWMAIGGQTLQTIGAALGHKSLQSTMRYSHLIDASVREGREAGLRKMQAMTRRARQNGQKLLSR